MNTDYRQEYQVLRDLGDGLILRRAGREDAQKLGEFNARIHSDNDEPNEKIRAYTVDLLERPHPTFHPSDFMVVEDTRSRQIISSLNLIDQVWSYGGIPFKVGRPELVGTLPDYRNRGLVRAQFEVVHHWSAERGQVVQGITGIPYYYRLFGYEMALNLGGLRVGFGPHIPDLPAGKEEPYRVRPATEDDLSFIGEVYNYGMQRCLLASVWDLELWRYELLGKSENNINLRVLEVIESAAGEPVGFLTHGGYLWGPSFAVNGYELKPGVSWVEVTPSVIRFMRAQGKVYAERDQGEFGGFAFVLGEDHPAYHAVADRLPRKRDPYAWYVRVPDLPGFLNLVKPVLEERLSRSLAVNHSGELKITFYREGLRILLEKGKLSFESWKPEIKQYLGDAGFPGLTFLQLVFGYRSLAELRKAYPDVFVDGDEANAILPVLFPRLLSEVWPIS